MEGSTAQAPRKAPVGIRAALSVKSARRRWLFSLRAGVCMAAPVLAGQLAGDVPAGLMATIGGFTALYGTGRPYRQRARELALIGVAFGLSVGLGDAAAAVPWLGVLTVVLIAMTATWVCNALGIGPPGAYLFTLACASGTFMHAEHLSSVRSGELVVCGAAFAWAVHMAGAVWNPRGPEKAAVGAAAVAVADYVASVGGGGQESARHQAALAMHQAWMALVVYQPARSTSDGVLTGLRRLNSDLHVLFASAMGAAEAGRPVPEALEAEARTIGRLADEPPQLEPLADEELPLGRPSRWEVLRHALRPGSRSLLVVARVGVASVVTGGVAGVLGIERAYWAVAAAVLVLYQGADLRRTLQRSLERVGGTWAGLLLAAALLTLHPRGLWLPVVMFVLQLTIELTVLRNYALAVLFITAVALTIVSGGQPVDDLWSLLLARGVDTAIGCVVAVLVFVVMRPRGPGTHLSTAIFRAWDGVAGALPHLADDSVTAPEAKRARHQLQQVTFGLTEAYERTINSSARRRRTAERLWPVVAATQRMAYRVLAAFWQRQVPDGARDEGGRHDAGEARLDESGVRQVLNALAALRTASLAGGRPPPLGSLPPLLRSQLGAVHDSLTGLAADALPDDEGHPGSAR